MPLFEYECQECGEHQTVAVMSGEAEAPPPPCSYCGGTVFVRLPGAFAAATSAVKERHQRTEKAMAKAAQSASPPAGCPNAQCPSHQLRDD